MSRSIFDLQRLIEDISQLLAFHARNKGIKLCILIEEGTHFLLKGDPTKLRQVLINLIGNAIKFTEKGEVVLRASTTTRGGDNLVDLSMSIVDTGMGIRAQDLPRLFKPFSQVDGSTTRKYGGTGLGLTISMELVSLMGGNLDCESRPGKGSKFFFSLPMEKSQEDPQKDAPIKSEEPFQPVVHSRLADGFKAFDLHVLVAEDNLINQELTVAILKKFGCRVSLASNGRQAVEMFLTKLPDLILMDCLMPVMDGYQATFEIRTHEKKLNIKTPIVALTANALEGDKERCLASGMDDYLSKPFKQKTLQAVLSRWSRPE